MGIKERRQREITLLKTNILKCTRDLAAKHGWEEVSIRKIANAIEYTPPVIYEHFVNKEAILKALEEDGFRQLTEVLEDTRRVGKSPGERLGIQAEAYWDFAMESTELYQVMFHLEGVYCTPDSTDSLKNTGKAVIDAIREARLFSGDLDAAFFQWWALVHGFVTLALSGHLTGREHSLRFAMGEAIKRFVADLAREG